MPGADPFWEVKPVPFRHNEEGQTPVEYALMLVLIIIIVILFILVVWPAIQELLPEINLFREATATPVAP